MSVKKQAAYVCDYSGEASMDVDDFYAFKIPGQRKYRHVHKSQGDKPFGEVIAKALAASNGSEDKTETETAAASGKAAGSK